ncbi:MAG TPA: hypothetical protein VED40_05495 [Azospirillaceae bacterium]|nr:hypothetical protein [Azospirillaceae bacterium]
MTRSRNFYLRRDGDWWLLTSEGDDHLPLPFPSAERARAYYAEALRRPDSWLHILDLPAEAASRQSAA